MAEPIDSPAPAGETIRISHTKMVEEINKTQDYMTLGKQPLDAVPAE